MLRKGRWDELFFVDLPNLNEREAIWKIVIGKNGQDFKDFDLIQLARMTEGLTGQVSGVTMRFSGTKKGSPRLPSLCGAELPGRYLAWIVTLPPLSS